MRNALDLLRDEYRQIGEHLDLIKKLGRAGNPTALRLQAREMEIVDAIAAAGLSPDVLIKPIHPVPHHV